MKAFIRVKIKSLAVEARIIRYEERRSLAREHTSLYRRLRDHRRDVVRPEARAAQLAYAFMREKPYSATEQPRKDNPPPYRRVAELVSKYNRMPKDRARDAVSEWIKQT